MNDGLMNWLQNPRQQGQSSAPAAPTAPEQAPNGKMLADLLRNKFHLDQMTPDMGGLGGVIGKFASPFLSFIEGQEFTNNGRNMSDADRQALRARMAANRQARQGQPRKEMNPELAQMFSGFKDMFGNGGQ